MSKARFGQAFEPHDFSAHAYIFGVKLAPFGGQENTRLICRGAAREINFLKGGKANPLEPVNLEAIRQVHAYFKEIGFRRLWIGAAKPWDPQHKLAQALDFKLSGTYMRYELVLDVLPQKLESPVSLIPFDLTTDQFEHYLLAGAPGAPYAMINTSRDHVVGLHRHEHVAGLKGLFRTLMKGGKVIGVIGYQLLIDEQHRPDMVVVTPMYPNELKAGAGFREIIEAVTIVARSEGARRIQLYAEEGETESIRAFQELGFTADVPFVHYKKDL